MMKDASHTLSFESDDIPFLDRKEAEALGVALFTAHWRLFIPTVVLTVAFACIWVALTLTGQSHSDVGRFFIVAMALLLPLLGASAFLRFQTTRVQIHDDYVAVHTGNLMSNLKELDLGKLKSVTCKVSAFGAGSLFLEDDSGSVTVLRSLKRPEAARDAIVERLSK